jgi:hypothetical protein
MQDAGQFRQDGLSADRAVAELGSAPAGVISPECPGEGANWWLMQHFASDKLSVKTWVRFNEAVYLH